MLQQLSPETGLFQAATLTQLARGNCLHEHVIVVEIAAPPFVLVCARTILLINVRHVLLPERAVVKPVVAHPTVNHRIHRHRNLQRRMRIHQRHQRQKAIVRNPQDADFAVAFRDVLD